MRQSINIISLLTILLISGCKKPKTTYVQDIQLEEVESEQSMEPPLPRPPSPTLSCSDTIAIDAAFLQFSRHQKNDNPTFTVFLDTYGPDTGCIQLSLNRPIYYFRNAQGKQVTNDSTDHTEYFAISRAAYLGLTRAQMLYKMHHQIKETIESEAFKGFPIASVRPIFLLSDYSIVTELK